MFVAIIATKKKFRRYNDDEIKISSLEERRNKKIHRHNYDEIKKIRHHNYDEIKISSQKDKIFSDETVFLSQK